MITIDRNRSDYPKLFRGIEDEPTILYALGDPSLLNSVCVAIVGTREPSPAGIQTAHKVAAWCVEQGYTIVAGLCPGIDAVAHKAALSYGGKTIAVLASTFGSDMDRVHVGNGFLGQRIVEDGGLLITETLRPCYPAPYIRRDRLQSALSLVVIPVQGKRSSGTRHTCECAIKQGRAIFCPKPARDDYYTHRDKYGLLEKLVESGAAHWFSSATFGDISQYIQQAQTQ